VRSITHASVCEIVAVAARVAGTGLIGVLTDCGVPKARVEGYETGIREGGILIALKTRSNEDAARLVPEWRASGGEFVHL